MSPRSRTGSAQLFLLGWLVVVWVALWGTLSWANLLSGLVVALLVTWLLPLPPVQEHARFRPAAVLSFVGHFLVDLAVSSAQVAWQAVRPGPPVRSAIIEVQLRTDSDLVTTLVAETLTLVPGSMVFDVDRARRVLLMHVLPATDAASVEAHRIGALAVEERVVKAFGTAEDVAALAPMPPQSPAESGGGRP